jgi:hypothetical protein
MLFLHNDPSAPVVITSVCITWCQRRKPRKLVLLTFEHLLFEGTENIKRGEWFKIVTGKREQTMPTLLTIELIITKFFLQTI